jgi:hypothetical protein
MAGHDLSKVRRSPPRNPPTPRSRAAARARPNRASMSTPEMLDLNINGVLDMAVASLAFCALIAVAALSFSLRRWQIRCASVESSLAAMRRELEVAASISLRTGRRVNRIERECSGVADRIESVELRGPARCFDQAIVSARRGTDPGRLTQQFGLSPVEAELVTRLHGRKRSASAF